MFPPLRTNSEMSQVAVDSTSSPLAAPVDAQGHKSYNLRIGDRPLVRLSLHTPLFGEVRMTSLPPQHWQHNVQMER